MLEAIQDPLSEHLDSRDGHLITDTSIFTDLPRYWEQSFHEDMDALNVKYYEL